MTSKISIELDKKVKLLQLSLILKEIMKLDSIKVLLIVFVGHFFQQFQQSLLGQILIILILLSKIIHLYIMNLLQIELVLFHST